MGLPLFFRFCSQYSYTAMRMTSRAAQGRWKGGRGLDGNAQAGLGAGARTCGMRSRLQHHRSVSKEGAPGHVSSKICSASSRWR